MRKGYGCFTSRGQPRVNEMIERIDRDFTLPLVEEISQASKKMENVPMTELSFGAVKEYLVNGHRLAYEKAYFDRRKRLSCDAIRAMELPTKENIALIENTLFQILQEFTWALPAHWPNEVHADSIYQCIDLFQAETGQAIAEILYYLEPFLSKELYVWCVNEIENRILIPFEKKEWEWEKLENNWSAVIASSIGMITLRLVKKTTRKNRLLLRVKKAVTYYFKGFKEDGICEEGIGYWAYGFGYYLYFSEMYEKIYNIPFMEIKQMRRIAAFPYVACVGTNRYVPFSDYTFENIPSGLLGYIESKWNIPTPPVQEVMRLEEDHCYRLMPLLFSLRYSKLIGEERKTTIDFFEQSQWAVAKFEEEGIVFFVKGGSNAESHNHKDIGHFVIGTQKQWVFDDFGAGEYTKEYFIEELRDQFFSPSSFAHSVPVIDGLGQLSGKVVAKILEAQKSFDGLLFTLDLTEPYEGNTNLERLIRSFSVKKGGKEITLSDTYQFFHDGSDIQEVFVSRIKPEKLDAHTLQWRVNSTSFSIHSQLKWRIHEKTYTNHFGKAETVYQLIVTQKCKKQEECSFLIQIENDEKGEN